MSKKKKEKFNEGTCDWRYNAAVTADCDCFEDCSMPCPYDKKKSPCDMCGLNDCNKEECEAYKIYNEKQGKLQQSNDVALKMEGI